MKALILSGGGAKGAFTVGALKYLDQAGLLTDLNIVSGTSTGSLIAAMFCAGKLDDLLKIYKTVKNEDVFWYNDIPTNLFNKRPYLLSTIPLRGLIKEKIQPADLAKIKAGSLELYLTAVSLQTGRPMVFCSHFQKAPAGFDSMELDSIELLHKALEASSNQGVFLEPIKIEFNGNTQQFIDGGHREVLPTGIVKHRLSATNEMHTVYLISNNPRELSVTEKEYTSVAEVLMRVVNIFVQDVREHDVAQLEDLNNVNIIPIYPGEEDIDKKYTTGLRFNKKLMLDWMNLGTKRAKDKVARPV